MAGSQPMLSNRLPLLPMSKHRGDLAWTLPPARWPSRAWAVQTHSPLPARYWRLHVQRRSVANRACPERYLIWKTLFVRKCQVMRSAPGWILSERRATIGRSSGSGRVWEALFHPIVLRFFFFFTLSAPWLCLSGEFLGCLVRVSVGASVKKRSTTMIISRSLQLPLLFAACGQSVVTWYVEAIDMAFIF